MKRFFILALFIIFQTQLLFAQYPWVDSVFSQLSLKEKIAQLMIIRVPSDENDKTYPYVLEHIKNGAGGICFFAGKSDDQLRLTRHFQKEAKVPLFVSIDGEWGLGMRLKDGYSFPRQMMLGALSDDELVYKMGQEVAFQCKKMGIHINYAPDCDINTNPVNPVIGNRSFGENKNNVTRKSVAYTKGLQDNGVMAVAKHFPGHGDTETDSHHDLPVLKHSKRRLHFVELFPFKELINNHIGGIMIGHLYVPSFDTTSNLPASLSYPIVNELLRKQMEYSGLIFTDGMEMRGVTKHFKNGQAELKALQAGNDIILLPANVDNAINAIFEAAEKDSVLRDLIDVKCKRILTEKHIYGLSKPFSPEHLALPSEKDFYRADVITNGIAQKSLTLLKNEKNILPIKNLNNVKIGLLNIDAKFDNSLSDYLERYTYIDKYALSKNSSQKEIDSILKLIPTYNYWIISCYGTLSNSSKNYYGFSEKALNFIRTVQQKKGNTRIILGIFGSPYILSDIKTFDNIDAIIMGYQNIHPSQDAFSQIVFGGLEAKGILPVSSSEFEDGSGLHSKKVRLAYKKPEQIDVSSDFFEKIDSIANRGIIDEAYPGCQVLVAKDGDIIHNKSYGRITYNEESPWVTDNTLYDIASVTKVAGTTLALMKLLDDKMIKLNDPLSRYLPYLSKDKQEITIQEALSHIAGFKAYSPFWRSLVADTNASDTLFSTHPKKQNDYFQLTDSFFVKKDYKAALLDSVANYPLFKQRKYVYSDFGFILLADLIERVVNQPLDTFLYENFYKPLGMNRTLYNPLQSNISKNMIAPTENDTLFRKSVVHGVVHDPTAALMGGIAGHAGLFSTANDLAKLFQMLLNEGRYGDKQYLDENIIKAFNYQYYSNEDIRRALGFDKPNVKGESSHVCDMVSQSSFGHTGFTGTMVWVDPEYDLIYIFLSNRVHPNADPNRLAALNIRTNIQETIYSAILESQKNQN